MRLDAQRSMNWDKARDSVPLRLATGVKYWLLRGAFSRISQQHAALDWPDGVGLRGSSEHIQPSRSRPAASVPEPGVERKRGARASGHRQPSGTGTDWSFASIVLHPTARGAQFVDGLGVARL